MQTTLITRGQVHAHLLTVESAIFPSKPLTNHFCGLVHKHSRLMSLHGSINLIT